MNKKLTAREAAEIAFSYRETINVDHYIDAILDQIKHDCSVGRGRTVIPIAVGDIEQVLIGFKLRDLGYSFKWSTEHPGFLTVYWIA